MDSRLDELIAAAAPPVAERTPELRREWHALVAATEAAANPAKRRLGRRVGVAAFAVIAVFGAGAAANASGFLPLPSWGSDVPSSRQIELTLPSGGTCDVTYSVSPQELAPRADQAASLRAAQQFLDTFDIATISIGDAVAKYKEAAQATHEAAEKSLPASEVPPKENAYEVEVRAVGAEVYDRLSDELTRQGLSPRAIMMDSFHRCDLDGSM